MSLRNFARSARGIVFGRKPPPPFSVHHRRYVGAYDNDGKTYVSMLNNCNVKEGIMISAYSQFGFRLNNNFMVLGPVICFSNALIAWYIDDDSEVSEDSLSLLFHLEPMPSVVVLGVGDNAYRSRIDRTVVAATKKYGCNVEVLPIDAALATYNFMVSEGRHVAGAFIPPRFIPVIDDDVITANARHLQVYGEDLPKEDVWVDDEEYYEKVNENYKEFGEVVGAQNAADVEKRSKLEKKKKNTKKID